MSTFSRPRSRFNRQICQDIKLNLGRNQYGIANQKPNNPLSFTLASLQKAISDGVFMKSTITGTKLPNPINQLKAVTKPLSGGNNKPPPRIPLTQYTVRQNENVPQNNAVRRQAMQNLRQQVIGRMAVTPNPNIMRKELLQTARLRQSRQRYGKRVAQLRSDAQKIKSGFELPPPSQAISPEFTAKLTPEEEKIFTYQEFVDKDEIRRKEVRGFFKNLLANSEREKSSATPATEAQKQIPRRSRAARRRQLDMGDKKNSATPRAYEETQIQQVLNED
jgi:hypothetical protein